MKRIPVLSWVMYVLSVLLTVFTAWSFVKCWQYIAGMIDDMIYMGQASSFREAFQTVGSQNIIVYFMERSITYLLFAIVIFGVGWLIYKYNCAKYDNCCAGDEEECEEDDEVMDITIENFISKNEPEAEKTAEEVKVEEEVKAEE